MSVTACFHSLDLSSGWRGAGVVLAFMNPWAKSSMEGVLLLGMFIQNRAGN